MFGMHQTLISKTYIHHGAFMSLHSKSYQLFHRNKIMRCSRIYQKIQRITTQSPTYVHKSAPLTQTCTKALLLHMFFEGGGGYGLAGGGGRGPVSNVDTWLAAGTRTLQSLA